MLAEQTHHTIEILVEVKLLELQVGLGGLPTVRQKHLMRLNRSAEREHIDTARQEVRAEARSRE
jgi:hypothetical protein